MAGRLFKRDTTMTYPRLHTIVAAVIFTFASLAANAADLRGSGDLGIIIERAEGSVLIIETTHNTVLQRIEGLGDLSHASAVFSRDARYAYIFGRDGGLSKIDLLRGALVKRLIQGGNSIGGAISQDGKVIAVSNYEPGGVKLFDADSLELLADIPATYGKDGKTSKTVGLTDAPGQKFVFSLFDGHEIWLLDAKDPRQPHIQKFTDIGLQPYDALMSANGRFYIAGLFGEDGLALLDLWQIEKGVRRILPDYGKDDPKLPVYKMPHLEGWALTDDHALFPAVGRHEALVASRQTWDLMKKIPLHGQPVFIISRPDGRQAWVNFALPNNDTVQVIDTLSLEVVHEFKPGKGVLHMEFTPRGEAVWISLRDEDKVQIYATDDFSLRAELPAHKPSGIFFTRRAHETGL
jgi:protein NirF